MSDWQSRWLKKAAYCCLAIGALGFFVFWSIGWITESRVLGSELTRETFSKLNALRTVPVEMKGKTFYLEEDWGRNYNFSQRAILGCWIIGAIGGAYIARRQRKDR